MSWSFRGARSGPPACWLSSSRSSPGSGQPERLGATRLAACLAVALALVAVGCDGGTSAGPALRSGSLASLLEPLSLDATRFCILTTPGEEEEGSLSGAVEQAGATFHYAGNEPDPLQSNLHVTLDRFASARAAERARDGARGDARASLGAGARAAGSVPGWPGSGVDGVAFTDYTGRSRSSWSAVAVVDDTVVRIRSFGVPDVGSRRAFADLARGLLDGFVGRAPRETVPVCAGP